MQNIVELTARDVALSALAERALQRPFADPTAPRNPLRFVALVAVMSYSSDIGHAEMTQLFRKCTIRLSVRELIVQICRDPEASRIKAKNTEFSALIEQN